MAALKKNSTSCPNLNLESTLVVTEIRQLKKLDAGEMRQA